MEQAPNEAFLTVCGLGYYEIYINGSKVGDHVLDPGFTDYSKTVLYVTYEVSKYLRQGNNVIGVVLGGGFYHLNTPDLFGFQKAPWTSAPKLLLDLNMDSVSFGSNEAWKWSTGPIIFNCIRGGETYDARLDMPGWAEFGFDDQQWKSVAAVEGPQAELRSQMNPPIRVTESIRPVSITEPKPDVYVFDLGVNIAGWANLVTSGTPGQKISLEMNEKLNADGTVDMNHCRSHTYGRFQTEEFVLKGEGSEEVFEPRFTYHGFQFVQVTGLREKPTLETITGKAVHTDPDVVGEFSCSDPRINLIHEMGLRTQLNNLHSIPTDCPQREKMGWLLDGCVTIDEAMMNFDMANFYRKWFQDVKDAQEPNGHLASIIPTCGWGRSGPNGEPHGFSDPWWGGAIVLTPWRIYQWTGDDRILAEGYEAMKGYVDYLISRAQGGFIDWSLGDWLEVGSGGNASRTPIVQTSTVAYYLLSKRVAQSAEILGKTSDFEKYLKLSQTISDNFNERFLDKRTGLYAPDSQSAQALPLLFGMVPEETRELVLNTLLRNIREREGHLSTGIVATYPLIQTLMETGNSDILYEMVTKEDFPGWLWMAKNGSTTIWEAWQDSASRNHPAFACIDTWFYQGIGGIRPLKNKAGWTEFHIRPEPVGDLTWANTSYKSINGTISTQWKRKGNIFLLDLTVPVGTKAEVFIPTTDPESLKESRDGRIEIIEFVDGRCVLKVGSGTYSFQSRL